MDQRMQQNQHHQQQQPNMNIAAGSSLGPPQQYQPSYQHGGRPSAALPDDQNQPPPNPPQQYHQSSSSRQQQQSSHLQMPTNNMIQNQSSRYAVSNEPQSTMQQQQQTQSSQPHHTQHQHQQHTMQAPQSQPHHNMMQMNQFGEQYKIHMQELHNLLNNHREQIDKISRRIYDNLYQLIKIKFGISEHDSDAMQAKYQKMVSEKLHDLQQKANAQMQQQQHQNQQQQSSQQNQNGLSDQEKELHENLTSQIFPHRPPKISGMLPNNSNNQNGNATTPRGMQPQNRTNGQQMYPGDDPYNMNQMGQAPQPQLSEMAIQSLQEQVEGQMMERDRQLECSLVSALVQLEAHKQSLLQVVSKMREQALANEQRQKKFVEILLSHQSSPQSEMLTATVAEKREMADREPFELDMLFRPPEQEIIQPVPPVQQHPHQQNQMPQHHSDMRMGGNREGSFYGGVQQPQSRWGNERNPSPLALPQQHHHQRPSQPMNQQQMHQQQQPPQYMHHQHQHMQGGNGVGSAMINTSNMQHQNHQQQNHNHHQHQQHHHQQQHQMMNNEPDGWLNDNF